jgi:type IV pilus assembly protein PilM
MSRDTAPIAIDIGTSAVKVVQAVISRGQVIALRKASVRLPQNYSWQPGGDPGPMQDALEAALQQAGVKGDRLVLVLPRHQVTLRFTQLPPGRPEELQKMAALEAEQHIPLPPAETVVSCEMLGPAAEDGGLAPVVIAAARKEVIQSYLSLLAPLKFRPEQITCDALCLSRLWSEMANDPSPAFLLDLGAKGLVINYLENGQLRMSRAVGGGGEALTKAFEADCSLGYAEAEQLKQTQGLRPLPESGKIADWVNGVVAELRRSTMAFGGENAPARLYLTGGASLTPGLGEALAVQLGRPVNLFCPGELLSPAEGALYGLAYAASYTAEKAGGLNLLLPEDIAAGRDLRSRRTGVALGVAAAIALLSFAGGGALLLMQREGQLKRQKTEWTEAQRTLDHAKSLTEKRTRFISQMDELTADYSGKQLFLDALLEIHTRAPKGIWLTGLILDRPPKATSPRECTLQISGRAPDNATAASFVASLSQISGAREVNLQNLSSVTFGERRLVDFNLSGRFILPKPAPPAETKEALQP